MENANMKDLARNLLKDGFTADSALRKINMKTGQRGVGGVAGTQEHVLRMHSLPADLPYTKIAAFNVEEDHFRKTFHAHLETKTVKARGPEAVVGRHGNLSSSMSQLPSPLGTTRATTLGGEQGFKAHRHDDFARGTRTVGNLSETEHDPWSWKNAVTPDLRATTNQFIKRHKAVPFPEMLFKEVPRR
jgi:hypothetical protein